MAIGNLQKILKERGMNFQTQDESGKEINKDEALRLVFEYMEKSFSAIIENLAVVNKNQVILLNEIKKLKEEE